MENLLYVKAEQTHIHFIRDLLSSNCNSYDDCGINVLDSAVLVEGLSYNDKISMCKFMEYCEQFYPDDDFDINDYIRKNRSIDSTNCQRCTPVLRYRADCPGRTDPSARVSGPALTLLP